jgi:hypothetical protein
VFVNERPVSVAPGARVRDAVEQLDHDLAELVGRGAAYVTDGVGRPVDAGDPVGEGGAIFRVVVSARQGPPRRFRTLPSTSGSSRAFAGSRGRRSASTSSRA